MSLQTTIDFNVTGQQPHIDNPIGNPTFPGATVCVHSYPLLSHIPSWSFPG